MAKVTIEYKDGDKIVWDTNKSKNNKDAIDTLKMILDNLK